MTKPVKLTILSFVLAAVCWLTELLISPADLEAELMISAVTASIAFLCFLAVSIGSLIAKNRGKMFSPYKIFAVTDIVIGVFVAACAVYDINTAVGFMAGIVGALLLIFVMPIILILLLADFVVWRYQNRDRSGKQK